MPERLEHFGQGGGFAAIVASRCRRRFRQIGE
jgi:hypothetical protein